MARRREQQQPDNGGEPRPVPPLWVRNRPAGYRHLGFGTPGGGFVLSDESSAALQRARADWCRENGCWQAGRSCEQAGVPPCHAEPREAG